MKQPRFVHPPAADLVSWAAGSPDARVAGHVARCERCRRVVDDWRTVGVRLGDALREEADRAFPADRLDAQRARIMQRIRAGGRARVLRFPGPVTGTPSHVRVFGADVRRWTAAAALAGMLVGALAGRFLLEPRSYRTASGAESLPAGVRPGTGVTGADEAFLVELDAAVFSSSPQALRALDALTPGADR